MDGEGLDELGVCEAEEPGIECNEQFILEGLVRVFIVMGYQKVDAWVGVQELLLLCWCGEFEHVGGEADKGCAIFVCQVLFF